MIWSLLVLLLLLSFLLAGLESALLTVSRVRVRHAAEDGDQKAARLARLLERRDELLHVIAVTNHLCLLSGFACASVIVVRAFGYWSWAAVVLVILPLLLVLVELLPKHLFANRPFRSLRRSVGFLSLLHLLARPWLHISRRLKPSALALLPTEPDNAGLDNLIRTIASLQLLHAASISLMHQYAVFNKSHVRDLMMPLRHLTALPPDIPLANIIGLSKEQKHPWRTVLADNGKLLGWLDITALPIKPHPDKLVSQYLRPISHVRHSETALHTLQHLRKRGEPVAAVLDDQQHVIGVITQQALMTALFRAKS